jgi:hypothetical protein
LWDLSLEALLGLFTRARGGKTTSMTPREMPQKERKERRKRGRRCSSAAAAMHANDEIPNVQRAAKDGWL